MHTKYISPNEQFRDIPVTTFLNVGSRGLDRDQLHKIAAAEQFVWNHDVKKKPGKAYLHLITTGDWKTYGANNNGDAWPVGSVKLASLDGKKCMTTDGGLQKFHDTFLKHAHVYEEHYNGTKGGPELGDVVAQCVNPVMKRGELIVEVDEKDWRDDLEKVANGEHLFWSIGASVPYDICSVCLNKAPTARHYCDDVKYRKLQLTKEGRQVCMINDQPTFHDISKVAVPADRIAFTLRKIASGQSLGGIMERRNRLYIPKSVIDKLATGRQKDRAELLYKLAEMEKLIPCELSDADSALSHAMNPSDSVQDEVVKALENIPLDHMLEGLNKEDVLLPPKVFVRITLRKKPEEIGFLDQMPTAVEDIFSKITDGGGLDEVLDDGSYDTGLSCPHAGEVDRMRNLAGPLSIGDEPVRHRIFVISAGGSGRTGEPDIGKEASEVSEEAAYMAREYAKYQLSYLATKRDADLEKFARRIVLANKR